MMTDELVKEVTKLEKYLLKHGSDNLVHDLKRLSKEELTKKITEYAIYRQEIQDCKANDTKLNEAKELVKELNAPHNDAKRMNDKIARFISLTLKDLQD